MFVPEMWEGSPKNPELLGVEVGANRSWIDLRDYMDLLACKVWDLAEQAGQEDQTTCFRETVSRWTRRGRRWWKIIGIDWCWI